LNSEIIRWVEQGLSTGSQNRMAHRILGLDIGATEVRAVLAEVTWRDATVLGVYAEPVPPAAAVANRPLPSAQEPGEPAATDAETPVEPARPAEPPPPWVFALADLLKKHNLEYNEVHCALGGAKATSRILTLPFDNRRRLEQVLPFELENLVPFELEDMHLAFEVLGKDPAGGYRVLVTLAPKTEMERFLAHLALAGVDPRVVELAPYMLFAGAKLALPQELGAYAAVDIGATHTDIAVLNQGDLVELRTVPFGAERLDQELGKALRIDPSRAVQLKEEKADVLAGDAVGQTLRASIEPLVVRLRQTLQGLHSSKNLEVTRLYLTGRGALLAGLDRLLGDELAVEVERLRPFSGDLPFSFDVQHPAQQARYPTALALVYHGVGPLRRIHHNLRHGQFFYKRQQLAFRSSLRSLGVVGAFVFVLLVYNIVASQMQKRSQLAGLQGQISQLYLKAFPGSAPPLQPVDQFRAQVAKTLAKERAIGYFGDDNLRAIDLLRGISELTPPNMTVDIKKFDLAQDALKIEGEVASFNDVDQMEKALQQFPGFKGVKKESSKDVSDKIKFRFLINLVDKKPKTTPGAKPGAVPGAPAPAAAPPASPTPAPALPKPPGAAPAAPASPS
jgi:type IV pilus assembly protein PilM